MRVHGKQRPLVSAHVRSGYSLLRFYYPSTKSYARTVRGAWRFSFVDTRFSFETGFNSHYELNNSTFKFQSISAAEISWNCRPRVFACKPLWCRRKRLRDLSCARNRSCPIGFCDLFPPSVCLSCGHDDRHGTDRGQFAFIAVGVWPVFPPGERVCDVFTHSLRRSWPRSAAVHVPKSTGVLRRRDRQCRIFATVKPLNPRVAV